MGRSNTPTDIGLRHDTVSTHKRKIEKEFWQEPIEKTKTKEVKGNVIDERCQILRQLRKHSDHTLQQTRLIKDASTVEDFEKYFFDFNNLYYRFARH